MADPLLDPVQRALCCPNGKCRALAAGSLADCGAKLTKEHAEAAIRTFRRAQTGRIKALLWIRDEATTRADIALKRAPDLDGLEAAYRTIARTASDALKETGE